MKNKKENRLILCIVGIIIASIVLLIIIISIFSNLKGKNIEHSDWLVFLGSYLGFSGSLVLGVVAVYQNKVLKDTNDEHHNNEIKPIINLLYREKHILNVVDMKEDYQLVNISNDNIEIYYTSRIPREILKLYKQYGNVAKSSSDYNVSYSEFSKIQELYYDNLDEQRKSYLLIDFYIDNNGNGNAIDINLTLNNKNIEIMPSLQSNKSNCFLVLLKVESNISFKNLNFKMTYTDIDNTSFTSSLALILSRDNYGRIILK